MTNPKDSAAGNQIDNASCPPSSPRAFLSREEIEEIQAFPAADDVRRLAPMALAYLDAEEKRGKLIASISGAIVRAGVPAFGHIEEGINKLRAAVIEECAKVCEETPCECCWNEDELIMADECATRIRALSQPADKGGT